VTKFNLRKIVSTASLISSISVIILSALYLLNIWVNAAYAYIPLMGVNLACQAYTQWIPNRKIAWFNLVAAIFVGITYIAVLIRRIGG
jgi:hypothetical protein